MNERQKIEAELFKLNKIEFIKPTAAQLHGGRHALVSRVQRMEDKRYWEDVQKKKVELEKKLLGKEKKLPKQGNLKLPKRTLTRIESKKRLRQGRYGR